MQHLDPKAVWLFFFSFTTQALFLLLILGYVFFFATGLIFFRPDHTGPSLAAGGILFGIGILSIVLVLLFLFFWAKLSWKNYKYELKDKSVDIERGVLWKRYSSIPYERIQNVDILRGILARLLGLSDLQIQTAGYSGQHRGFGIFGLGSEGRLPGLNQQVAITLREELLKRVDESQKEQGI